MNVRREGDAYVAVDGDTVLGTLHTEDGGSVALRLEEPREGVALALLRALAAEATPEDSGEESRSFGSVHLQTDDQGAVVKLVERLAPRAVTSRETVVSPPRNGWVTVYDEVADRDPNKLRALGRELSNGSGYVTLITGVEQGPIVHLIAMERGRLMDEYVSVPSFRDVAPGDAIALRANPTVLSRLTGADPARIRAAARTAESPDELPPAEELIAEVASALGLEGADYGFEGAREVPGAAIVEHE